MFTATQAVAWVRSAAAVIEEHAAELTKLDSAIGDGDHGTNMNRGFKAALQRLDALEGDQDFAAVFKAVGMALIGKVGGQPDFSKLEVAWRFKTDALGPRPEFNFQSTPLMVGGKLYTTAGTRRAVVSLDAATGEMLWMYSLNEGARGDAAPRRLSGRGLSYWTDGRQERILYVTPGYQLIALDARSGQPCRDFGANGVVNLKVGLRIPPFEPQAYSITSPPVAVNGVVIAGVAGADVAVWRGRSVRRCWARTATIARESAALTAVCRRWISRARGSSESGSAPLTCGR